MEPYIDFSRATVNVKGNFVIGEIINESFNEGGKMKDTHEIYSILFLAADPTDESRLRLGQEFRDIEEQLTLSNQRDRFKLELPQLSLRSKDITRALLKAHPQIVHFSGHGASDGTICFENDMGEALFLQPDALAALFQQFSDQVKCVLLNACYTEAQAQAIGKHIKCVIGMNKAIDDRAAIAFSIGFYQALGAGRTFEEAYDLGCVQIRLQGIPDHLTPVFIRGKENQTGDNVKQEPGEYSSSARAATGVLQNLSEVDRIILKTCGDKAIEINRSNMIDVRYILEEIRKFNISEESLFETIEILDERGYIKPLKVGGGHIPGFDLTLYGFEEYATAYIKDYQNTCQLVCSRIINNNENNNKEIAEKMQLPLVLISHIINILDNKGLVQIARLSGGNILILKVSAELKRALRAV